MLRHRIRSAIIHLRIYLGVSFLTFIIILPPMLKEDPTSPYYKAFEHKQPVADRVSEYKRINDIRIAESEAVLSSPILTQQKDLLMKWHPNAYFKVLITVITMSRNQYKFKSSDDYQPKYLKQVLARLIKLKLDASDETLTGHQVLICDVDTHTHSELESLESLAYVSHTNDELEHHKDVNKYEREKLDYVSCLNRSLSIEADYILLMEDDALPHINILEHLDHLFSSRLQDIPHIGFIKLFHPTRLNGYITADLNRLLEWFAIASVLEHFLLLLRYLFSKNFQPDALTRLLWYTYFLLLVLAIGRKHIISFRQLSPYLHRLVPAPSCCTPAIIFTPSSASAMTDYLTSTACRDGFAKDSAMDLFATKTGLSTWFFEPNLFSHIGVYTTRRKSLVDPIYID